MISMSSGPAAPLAAPRPAPPPGGAPLARVLVDLLRRRARDDDEAADRAIARRLAGLFLEAGCADAPPAAPATAGRPFAPRREGGAAPSPAAADRLARARRREAMDAALAAAEIDAILATLAEGGVVPLVLKGRPLAERAWPRPELRPAGDLDLLVAPPALHAAAAILTARGYRPAPAEPPSLLRPAPTGLELLPPPGRRVAVDLHQRPFRTVGGAIRAGALLERARPTTLLGHPIRVLDDADLLLYLLVHAAKHGARNATWLLDLHGLGALLPAAAWDEARRRAAAASAERPFYAACLLCAALAGLPAAAAQLPRTRPRWPWPALLDRLFDLDLAAAGRPPGRFERYALEIALEPSLRRRARAAAGLVERLLRRPPEG
jgi:Uncharacterised nucleotidyltransferase